MSWISLSLSSMPFASSVSTLSILLFGDLSMFVLGDVDLVNLFNVLFALPIILASDPTDVVSGGATLPSPILVILSAWSLL